MFRIGLGYDIHQLVADRPLVLGGVTIPYSRGLLGHSDGDALLHAAIDAILGALGLGDIGSHFPDTDPVYKDADSAELLREVLGRMAAMGFVVVNVDSTIIAQAPRLQPHIASIRERMASLMGIDPSLVNVKAKTNEGVGPEGRGEAISTQAIVLLTKNTG